MSDSDHPGPELPRPLIGLIRVAFRCISCDSLYGRPGSEETEHWVWIHERGGIIGPFCSHGCANAFHYNPTNFSSAEMNRLFELKMRTTGGAL